MTEPGHGITAIDTGLLRPQFDASHLVVENGRAAFVDVGVNDSVPRLLQALDVAGRDPGDVDYVFLTHVHLDHAGGAGRLLAELPNAMAVLHPRGAPHMVDPARLVRGATAVYGEAEFRRQYGDIVPIDEARIRIVADDETVSLAGRELRVLHTEGHARHHYCLADGAAAAVFTGDSFGISYRELDTARGAFIYPTTTPVHFDPPEAHKAIDRILSLAPQQLLLTHYSRVVELPRLADDMHRRIDDFVALVGSHANRPDRTARMHADMLAYFIAELREHGFAGSDEDIRQLLDIDVRLNTMGLEYWQDHGR